MLIKHVESNQGNGPGLAGLCQIDFEHDNIKNGIVPGTFVFDNFNMFEAMAATETDQNGWGTLIDTGCSIANVDEVGGVIRLVLAADNDDVCMFSGAGEAGFCSIPSESSDRKDFFAEARIKISDVSAAEVFFGVRATAQTSVIASTDNTLENVGLIGFHLKTTGMETVVKKSSTAETSTISTDLDQADGEWIKLSLRFTALNGTSGKLEFCVDGGEPVVAYTDITNSASGIPNSVVSDGTEFCACLCARANGAAVNVDVDHIAFGFAGGNE